MPKVESFNDYPTMYEQWFEKNYFAYKSELKAIKEFLPEKGKGIEIGVGSGRFAEPLGIRIGVDPSKEMRKMASQKGVEVFDAVAENLPFEDEAFDFALMTTTVCFLDNIEEAFKEANRVLKSYGCLIVSFIDKNSPIGKEYRQNKEKSIFYRVATFFSVDEIIFYLKRSGFKSFNFRQTLFQKLDELKNLEPVKDGYGEGSFVVIKAIKSDVV